MKLYRCWSWASVSSQKQAHGASLDEQCEDNQRFVECLFRHYPNSRGILSGETRLIGTRSIPSLNEACLRYPEYAKLVEMISNNEIDLIVCRDAERLGGRKLGLSSQLFDLCAANNIVVIQLAEVLPLSLDNKALRQDESGLIVTAVQGALSETYLRRFVARTKMGKEARVKKRKLFAGIAPYGYKYSNDGNSIVVDEGCRNTLLDIFQMYLSGHGEPQIALKLNEMGIPAPHGGKWYRSAFTPILKRIYVYAGFLEMYRHSDNDDHIIVSGNHEALITTEIAEEIDRERKSRSATRSIPHTPFAGTCICTSCGKGMVAFKNRAKRADGSEAVHSGYLCRNPECRIPCQIPSRIIREHIEYAIRRVMTLRNDELLDDLRNLSDLNDSQARIRATINRLEKRIADAEDGQKILVDLLIGKRINRQTFDEKSAALDREISGVRDSLTEQWDEYNYLIGKLEIDKRLDSIRQEGMTILAKEKEAPELVSRWLRARVRLYIRPTKSAERVERIEYI